jgi:N-acyl-D-amino-acid deacylase
MRLKIFFPLILKFAIIMMLISCGDDALYHDTYDILIRGGTIIDGTGNKGYTADLLIKDNMIVHVGKVNTEKIDAHEIIDAAGKVVAPGFIDAHAHGDPLSTPGFENFLAMGVTTITLGQDGSSPEVRNISEWMDEVDDIQPGVNIGMFVGHGTVRRLAGVDYRTEVYTNDLERMAQLVDIAMEAGCFGLSTGLEYEPGSLTGMDELVAIAQPVGRHGGLVMSHMRSEDDDKIESALEELLTQGLKADCPVQVSHIKITYGKDASRAEDILAQMVTAREKDLQVTSDLYPYTASYTGIGIVFPDWVKPPNEYEKVVEKRRDELAQFLRNRVAQRNGPEATLFGTEPWIGMTLADVALQLNKPFEDVLIDDIGLYGASAAYFVMHDDVMERFMIDPYVMICSDGSPTMHHPRGYGSFARIIRKYVNEKQLLTLEEAIHKMTGLTARTIGYDAIDNPRGFIKPNFTADLVIFNPDNVRDTAVFEKPHLLAEGFDYVFVNGIAAIEDGIFTGNRGGVVLKKQSINNNK